ncbi:MAG TPA: hypothetical protein VJB90_06070 [Candidatus Nanoarchaeia archaeon]|nr:hypothetical protein [Candidatus Nanoarchaeia archaeon]
MLGQDTVREVDGLTIATRLHGYRGGGSVDIVAGRNPLEVWSSIQETSPKGPKSKFRDSRAFDLWWLRTTGYEGVNGGFIEGLVGRHFGSVAYRAARKYEYIEDTVGGRQDSLSYEILLSSLPGTFGTVHFPVRHMSVAGAHFKQDPEEAVADFIMDQTAELRSLLKGDYSIYTYFEPIENCFQLEMYVRFGLGPVEERAQTVHQGLEKTVDRVLPAFQRLPYST